MNSTNNSKSEFINDFFNEMFNTTIPLICDNPFRYEVIHTKDGAYLLGEVPGFNKTNLKVEMEDGVLYVEGERTYKLNKEEKTKKLSFKSKLSTKLDPNEVEVTIQDGLLTVFIPKIKVSETSKRINLIK